MEKNRLEAFSDGVFAIIITIMVLELRAPHDAALQALSPLVPVFLSYVLSYVYIGIYWNNHHHMLQTVKGCTGPMLWANLHLLFWLSLIPFVTAWMGENHFAATPTALYGFVMLMNAIAYWILQKLDHHLTRPSVRAPARHRERMEGKSVAGRSMSWRYSRRSSLSGSLRRCSCWWRSSGWFRTGASKKLCSAVPGRRNIGRP